MDNQKQEGASGSLGPNPDISQVAGKSLDAGKSKRLSENLLLRLIANPTHLFDMLSRFSEHIEAEIPHLPPDQHTELLQMLFVLGTAEQITQRGIRFGWKYQAIEEVRALLTQGLNSLFHAYIRSCEATARPPDGSDSGFLAEMQHANKYLEQFTISYRKLMECQQGPFAGCAYCPAKCLYRPEVKSLLLQKDREWISEELCSFYT